MAVTMITGLPGASKSYMCCQQIQTWVGRNRKWYKKTGIIRPVRSNLILSKAYTDRANDMNGLELKKGVKITLAKKKWNDEHRFLEYWEDPEELPGMNGCDVIWEEMGAHVDSRSWEQLPHELRRWLQQHRHRGVEIVGNCQDFADVDVAVRRLTQNLFYLMKLIGSRDPSPTSLPPRVIWGFVLVLRLDAKSYDEKTKWKGFSFSHIEFISHEIVKLYSMFNNIQAGKLPPLQHRVRKCAICGYEQIRHI